MPPPKFPAMPDRPAPRVFATLPTSRPGSAPTTADQQTRFAPHQPASNPLQPIQREPGTSNFQPPPGPSQGSSSAGSQAELQMFRDRFSALQSAVAQFVGPSAKGIPIEDAITMLMMGAAGDRQSRAEAEGQLEELRGQVAPLADMLEAATKLAQTSEKGREQAEAQMKPLQGQAKTLQLQGATLQKDRDAAREGLSALQIATDAREAEFNQYIDQLDAKLHTCEEHLASSQEKVTQLEAAASQAASNNLIRKVPQAIPMVATSGRLPPDTTTSELAAELQQRLVAAQQRVVAAELAQAAAEGAARGRPVPVDARVRELQSQLSLAQQSCTYAEARWDEVMARLTEVCSAARTNPESPDRSVSENLKRQVVALTGERHGLVIALADAQAQIARLDTELEQMQQTQTFAASQEMKERSNLPGRTDGRDGVVFVRPAWGNGSLMQSSEGSSEELVASKEREAAAQDLVHKAHAQVLELAAWLTSTSASLDGVQAQLRLQHAKLQAHGLAPRLMSDQIRLPLMPSKLAADMQPLATMGRSTTMKRDI